MNKIKPYKKNKRCCRVFAVLVAAVPVSLFVLGGAHTAGAQLAARVQAPVLSLKDTIDRALENNVMVKLARARIEETKGLRLQSRSDLLPHLSLEAGQHRVFWDNAAAQGYPDFGVLGPFNSFDARAQLTQRIFDLSARSDFEAGDIDLKIARLERDFARQQIIVSAVMSYLNVLNRQEQLKAVDEDIYLAEQLVATAQHQLDAGVVTRLDVVRAKTRLAQFKAVRQNILERVHADYFGLMRVAGLPLKNDVRLNDSMDYFDEKVLPVGQALDVAFGARVEMSLGKEKIRYQSRKVSQARNDRLPKIDVYGNYGQSGVTPTQSNHEAAEIGIKMTMTPFEGGDIAGRIKEEESKKKSEEIKQNDLKVQIEEDVRLALQTLMTSTDRVRAAQEALDLAKSEVALAQNQYNAGLENNIAVIQAQDTLARAQEDTIASLMQYHLARVNYFSALGQTEKFYLNPKKDKGGNDGT